MKTELEIANERILELEKQVKKLSLNLPVSGQLSPTDEQERNYKLMVKNYHTINDEYIKYKNSCTDDCKKRHQFAQGMSWR